MNLKMMCIEFVVILTVVQGSLCQSSTQYQCESTSNEECLRAELNAITVEMSNLIKENQDLKQQYNNKSCLLESEALKLEKQQLNDVIEKLNKSLLDVRASKESLEKENQKQLLEINAFKNQTKDLIRSAQGCSPTSPKSCFLSSGSGGFISGAHRIKDTFRTVITKIQQVNVVQTLYSFNSNIGAFRMANVRDQLWVSFHHIHSINIVEFNTSKTIKVITHSNIRRPWSIRYDNHGHVLVCSQSGLHLLDQYGSYLYKIAGGYVSDIHVGCDVAYVYNYTSNSVVTLYYNNNLWVVNNSFVASRSSSYVWNTLVIINNTIYLCSIVRHTIETYTLSGSYITQYGSPGRNTPGQLYQPILCGVDSQLSILVCDQNNHRLQVLTSDGNWQVFVLQGVRYPLDTVIDTWGNTWVLYVDTSGSYKIKKFSV